MKKKNLNHVIFGLLAFTPCFVFAQYTEQPDPQKTFRSSREEKERKEKNVDYLNTNADKNRMPSYWTIGLGPFGSSNTGKGSMLFGPSIGKSWQVSQTGEVYGNFLAAFNSNGQFYQASTGYTWIPLIREVSPIIGGGLGLGFVRGNREVDQGSLTGEIKAGARFSRFMSVPIEILGTYATLIQKDANNIYGMQVRVLY